MASRRSNRVISTAVTNPRKTILETALTILSQTGNQAMSPQDIAAIGQATGLLRVPRGRTKTYLGQLLQSAMYGNPLVSRVGRGKYKARKNGLARVG